MKNRFGLAFTAGPAFQFGRNPPQPESFLAGL